MNDFCFWEYAMYNVEGSPAFQKTLQLPLSGLMTLKGVTSSHIDLAVGGELEVKT
jgi:hypothetical protein